jgi:cyclomaltodextrin glucanotransferase
MKKMLIMRIMLLALLILLAACVNVKEDEGKLTVVKKESGIEVILGEKAIGATVKIEGKVDEKNIKIESGKLKMVRYEQDTTLISITGNGEEFNNLFEVVGVEIKGIVLVESCKSIDLVIKNKKAVRKGEILLGDFNGDKTVDIVDFKIFKEFYGTTQGLYDIAPANKGIISGWEDIYSIVAKDGKVNILDLCVFSYNYLKVIPVEEKELQSVTVTGSSAVNTGSSIAMKAIATYSDNSTDSSVIWSSSDNAVATVDSMGNVYGVKSGTVTITATKTVNNITKTGSTSVTINTVESGIAIYIEEGYGDSIYTWFGSGTSKKEYTGGWPGSKYTVVGQKEKLFYKMFFKDLKEINYIILKGSGKLTGDETTTKDIWWTKDGKKCDENPYDYRPTIIVSPDGGTNKGDKEVSIIVTGENVTSKKASFNGKEIQLTAETTKIKLSDYLANKESGTLNITAVNAEGTKTKSSTFERDDSYVVPVIEAYGTLEPFAEHSVYFLLTDRFVNGDTTNDFRDQGKSVGLGTWDIEMKGSDGGSANIGYLGGDFQGIVNNADYIHSMGFGAVWLTPIIEQPNEAYTGGDPCFYGAPVGRADRGKTGYHGYWATNFYKLDEHLPSADMDFQKYTAKMKEKGLKTVLDIVCNHASPAFTMDQAQYDRVTSQFGRLFDESGKQVAASGNQPSGYSSWFVGEDVATLADFSTTSEEVFNYLTKAHLKWIDQGVDALRIDTVKHMPKSWWKRFNDAVRAKHPGMYIFGEDWGVTSAGMGAYQREADMDTLDFPCMWACKSVFGGNGSYDGLKGYLHIEEGNTTFKNPYTAATFYDNHDMPRMGGTDEAFINAHNWLFTTRGVPIIYYGSEMGFQRGISEHRGNRNYFGTEGIAKAKNHKIYKELSKIGKIRKENIALQKGLQINISLSGKQASFLRVYQHKGVNQTAVVMLNKDDVAKNVTVNKYITPGTWKDAETGVTKEFAGVISAEVPANGFKIFLLNEQITDAALMELCKKLTPKN